jgi:hypothetical protein
MIDKIRRKLIQELHGYYSLVEIIVAQKGPLWRDHVVRLLISATQIVHSFTTAVPAADISLVACSSSAPNSDKGNL